MGESMEDALEIVTGRWIARDDAFLVDEAAQRPIITGFLDELAAGA